MKEIRQIPCTTKGNTYAILAGILFGLTPLLAKVIYSSGSNAMTLALARMFSGMVIFYSLYRIFVRKSILLCHKQWKQALICAIAYVITPILVYSAYNYMDSGLVTTIHFVYPVLVLIGMVGFFHAKLSIRKICCCMLCFIGVLCFYGSGGAVSTQGIVMVLISAAAYAFYSIYLNESGLLDIHPLQLSFWLCTFGTLILLVVILVSGQLKLPETTSGWVILLLYGCIMAAALFSFQKGNYYIGSQKAAILSIFEPLTSVIVGIVVFREKLTVRIFVGFLCILISVYLLNRVPPTSTSQGKD